MTRIKVCGITNLEDARAAVDFGADALGFIFVPGTPRYVGSFPGAVDVPRLVPPFVNKVAVCFDVSEVDWSTGLFETAQCYSSAGIDGLPPAVRVVRVFRVRDEASLEDAARAEGRMDAVLLDTYHADKLGGSGETFNWDLACEARARLARPIILAGGLTPDNVADAVAAVRPYAVDVSSGVEAEPGRKDHARLRAFIGAVRRADALLDSRL